MQTTARINGQSISVAPRETLLEAALRQGVAFPNSCRVGGCATCKCRVTAGRVQERTESAYVLSAPEVAAGFVLGCQAVPLTDVSVEVEAPAAEATRRVTGRIVAQTALTHDIAQIELELDAPLPYRAGQNALLTLDAMPDVTRSYSFASPPGDGQQAQFFVRRVAGGALSTRLTTPGVVGEAVTLEGPVGDLWLRPHDAPLLCVAGGSGLAPLLAMLEHAAEARVARDVTLVFGARTAQDLYAHDRLDALAARWLGRFKVVRVLSAEPDDSTWRGARGRVTDYLGEALPPDTHAYLCGPPAMVDAAHARLLSAGLDEARVHCDRFVTQADVAPRERPAAPESSPADKLKAALHTLKFSLFHLVGLFAAGAILAGGHRIPMGLAVVLGAYVVGDALGGDDTSTPTYTRPGLLTAQLWFALPLLAFIVFTAVWSVCDTDPLGFGAAIHALTGYDALAARALNTSGHDLATAVITGLMIGLVGTIVGHELTHRTWDRISLGIGRGLLAFSFDTSFAIEHVYGHHRYVSTTLDPATAPRGRNVYTHIVVSTVRGNLSAWHIEVERLKKRGLPALSPRNAFIRGHLMSVGLVACAWAMGGAGPAAFFVACALWGKALLEIVNYMEHYGIVRDPATPVQPRHSWNTNRRVSSWTMFNLTRHSHHHAQGEVPFHALRPYPNAPMMVSGYLTTILLTLVPPLWFRLMAPRVAAWDRDFATAEERALAARAG